MARFFAFFTLFHLSLTFFLPEVPFNNAVVYCTSVTKNLKQQDTAARRI